MHLSPNGIEFDERRMALGTGLEARARARPAPRAPAAPPLAAVSLLGRTPGCWPRGLRPPRPLTTPPPPNTLPPTPPPPQIRAGATLRFPRMLPIDRDDPDAFKLQVHRLSVKTQW
jgi:hypothetical protein